MLQTMRKGKLKRRVMAWIMALLMVVGLLPTGLLGGAMEVKAAENVYILDATADLEAVAQGSKADGDTITAGTSDFFTIYASTKMKIDGSTKTFDDGYKGTQRINPGGTSAIGDTIKNAIAFKTEGTATVKIWWVSGGNGRSMAITDTKGTVIAATAADDSVKDTLYISTLEIGEPGNYYVTVPEGSNYIFKVQVTDKPPVINEYILDATTDLEAVAQGSKADGDTISAGTSDYFTIYASAKMKIDGSTKTFDDGYKGTQRINPGGTSAIGSTTKNAIAFKTEGTATVKIWWVSGGNGRSVAITDTTGTVVTGTTAGDSVKDTLYISTLQIENPGNYFVAVPEGSNYIFKVQVTDVIGGTVEEVPRKAWADVDAPALETPILKEGSKGTIVIPYTMVIGNDGADSVIITVKNSEGKELTQLKSIAEGAEGTKEYSPSDSGTYTFSIIATRDGEENKVGEDVTFDFLLPLAKPSIISSTSAGNGKIDVVWGAVKEAESYKVYVNGELAGTAVDTEFTVTDLTVGTKYAITVAAVRGTDESEKSDAKTTTATVDAKPVWGTTIYGPSTDAKKNGVVGDLNEEGKVTVYSEGGKGKIQPASTDGLAFYYTAIPTDLNFTLRAKVTVDSWTLSNGQDGFGIMVADRLALTGKTDPFWNNQYMAIASKVEYLSEAGNKYSMKLGLGVIEKIGVTLDNLAKLEANDTATVQNEYKSSTQTLDRTPDKLGLAAGTYNLVGNATATVPGTIENPITEFVLEIQRNNTGYFVTYYDAEGNVIEQIKYYGTDALDQLDKDYVYAGFFASRNARATFSDVVLTTIDPKDDAPVEEKPITKVEPTLTIQSADVANTENYVLSLIANVAGTATVKMGDKVIAADLALKAGVKFNTDIVLPNADKNEFVVEFTPDPDQDLGEDTILANTNKVTVNKTVTRCTRFENRNNIYVSPNGTPDAKGSKVNPVDIYTAVKYVQPGQTIIIMEGTYLLSSTVRVERGIDGTKDAPIKMIADPNAKTRPVFDFQGKCAGMVLGGDYWYFKGFDVTKSADAQKGIQVSGNNNTLDSINAYYNGNTGIQISRLFSADLQPDWPAYNLILNCTSYGNADAGYEDADGFAAKLTVGEGNVFDGCVAYNNADDGWDLYAKVETGPIGSVTIKNCVAYRNGYLEDGTNAGNGNGFKMGGESLSGEHKLINSYAFFNKAKGIDSNSCPDIIVENCISYNNESYNVAFYTNNAANTNFSATGIISFKDSTIKSGLTTGENLKPKGTQDETKYLGDTNYYWDGSKSANGSGATVDASWFKSLTFTGITRNADGTINMNGFLELTDKAPEDAGATPDGSASEKTEVAKDAKDEIVKEVEVTDKTTVDELLTAVDTVIDSANKSDKDVVPVLKLEVKDNTEIAAEFILGVKGEEVVIRVELENGILWDIYGKDITDKAVKTDLNVALNKTEIPKDKLDKVKELGAVTQLSIAHDGQFGFGATMKYAIGEAANGKHATLFWYNDGKFEKAGTFIVEDGCVEFAFNHASDYVIVLSDAEISNEQIEKLGDFDTTPIIFVLFVGLALIATALFFKKRIAK